VLLRKSNGFGKQAGPELVASGAHHRHGARIAFDHYLRTSTDARQHVGELLSASAFEI
jgi:hypothetical protein